VRLLVVVAHPDDESFGTGSVIADAVRHGHGVTVCCATRGEAGEARPGSVPDGRTLAAVRTDELHAAARELGVDDVVLLPYEDSGWDGPAGVGALVGAPLDDVVALVADTVSRLRPDLVVTLDPTGGDGHRDHVRIAEATTQAFDAAAPAGARLYYWCLARSTMRCWAEHNTGSVYAQVDDELLGRPDDELTTVVDVSEILPRRLAAMECHRTQSSPYDGLPEGLRDAFLATDRLVRARPPWRGGPLETALFA
jgi:LmbE family N-acetylglucosaminyl deacetylase